MARSGENRAPSAILFRPLLLSPLRTRIPFFFFFVCRRRSILDLLIRIECKGETDEQFESGRSLERWGIVRHREADGPVPAQDISHTSA